ncbi:MAG: PAS domain-containing protein [Bacteroidota bacterium]
MVLFFVWKSGRFYLQRARAEARLRDAESMYRLLFENMEEGFLLQEIITDDHGTPVNFRFLVANASCERHTGIDYRECIGKTILELFPGADSAQIELYGKVALTGKAVIFEYFSKTFNRHLRVRAFSPQYRHFATIFEDISEQWHAQEALRATIERLKLAMQVANMSWWEMNPETGKVTFENREVEMLGYHAGDFGDYKDFMALVHPEDYDRVMHAMKRHLDGDAEKYEAEYRIKASSGDYRWFLDIGSMGKSEPEGDGKKVTGVFLDITERKRVEHDLKQISARLSLATRAGGVGVWDYDIENNLLIWDEQMFALYGMRHEHFSGRYEAWLESIHPDDVDRCNSENEMAIRGEKEFDTEFRICWPDGSVHNIRALAAVQPDDTGRAVHMIGTNWDITEQKKKEEILLKAKLESEMANQSKSLFLANMSHEIRTPLNAIIGFSQLMSHDKVLTDSRKEYANSIIRAGEHLLSMLNDVLELSKMEAGRLELNQTNVDLYGLLADIQMIFEKLAQSKHLRFVFEIADDLPRNVFMDGNKLRRILVNLIGNAVKFTDQGGVAVRINSEHAGGDIENLVVVVQDSGPGISANELPKIFHVFEQTTTGIRHGSGTGLGLALSRELALLMGGDITLASNPEVGSEFTVHVKMVKTAAGFGGDRALKKVVRIAECHGPVRILIVDDQQDNLYMVSELLKIAGFETIEAVSGPDAIAKFAAQPIHLVLMDLKMPGMDGYETTKRLSSLMQDHHIPVVAITATPMQEAPEVISEMGFDGVISKPFHKRDLFGMIGKLLDISYVYEEQPTSDALENKSCSEVMAEDMEQLSDELISRMQHALSVADLDNLYELIKEIEITKPDLARKLMSHIINYDYNYLQKVLANKNAIYEK